jgi:hypothetical protein
MTFNTYQQVYGRGCMPLEKKDSQYQDQLFQ